MSTPRTTTLHRYAWQAGGQAVARLASFVALVVTARHLGLDQYGRFVVLLALLEAAMIPWKATPLQAGAAAIARSDDGGGWGATVVRWWVVGAIVLGSIAFVFDGIQGLGALLAASAASAVMFLRVPSLFLAGRQRRFAIGNLSAQITRLTATLLLIAAGWLTPHTALLTAGVGSIAGALVMWVRPDDVRGAARWHVHEVGTEGLRWTEQHAPILVVALLLGLQSAGGFDLLYKLIQAAAQLLAGIGVVMLPAFARSGEDPARVIARSLRLPTLLAIGLAVGAAVFIGPLLELVIGQEVGLGWAPAAFGLTLALAPWIGISRTALVTLGGSRWLLPSQAAISGMSVAASFLAVGGVLWAAVAVSAANLLGSLVRWLGIRALGHLPGRGWLGFGEWRADLVWLWGAARRKGVG